MYMIAVIGVQAFGVVFSRCTDGSVTSFDQCTGFFNTTGVMCSLQPTGELEAACLQNPLGMPFPRLWQPFPTENGLPGESFDDLPRGLLAVFDVLTGECAEFARVYAFVSTH